MTELTKKELKKLNEQLEVIKENRKSDYYFLQGYIKAICDKAKKPA